MKKTARTTALVIVPLAAAVNAHAGAILPTSNLSCSFSDQNTLSGSCTSQVGDGQASSQSGITGVSFFTSGSIGFGLSGGSSTPVQLIIGAGGPLSGNLAQNDPVGFNFAFSLISGGSVSSWNITMAFGNAFGNSSYGSFTASGSGGSGGSILESGSGTINIPSGGVASGSTFWETTTINAVISGGIFLQIDVPPGTTFDFNSAAASSVPEPASVGLIGSGLGLLGYLFRRRRRKA
ncbi:MAG TPA: PEP-CTERM sorting domain-containing protein [Bryobacteraceae bacterium]|jgi:hypothetical protein